MSNKHLSGETCSTADAIDYKNELMANCTRRRMHQTVQNNSCNSLKIRVVNYASGGGEINSG